LDEKLLQSYATNTNKEMIANILDKIMHSYLKATTENISMTYLLDWNHWPLFFSILGKYI